MATVPQANHPGRVLYDEVMKPLGISRNRLARDIDVPVGRISAIVSGTRTITADTALRLAKYFGTTPELWLKLQSDYDLAVARATVWLKIDPRVRVLDPAQPVPELPSASAAPETASVAIGSVLQPAASTPASSEPSQPPGEIASAPTEPSEPAVAPTEIESAPTEAVSTANEPPPADPVPASTAVAWPPAGVVPIRHGLFPTTTDSASDDISIPPAPHEPDAA